MAKNEMSVKVGPSLQVLFYRHERAASPLISFSGQQATTIGARARETRFSLRFPNSKFCPRSSKIFFASGRKTSECQWKTFQACSMYDVTCSWELRVSSDTIGLQKANAPQ